jgi:hypothetical protein
VVTGTVPGLSSGVSAASLTVVPLRKGSLMRSRIPFQQLSGKQSLTGTAPLTDRGTFFAFRSDDRCPTALASTRAVF